MTNSKNAAPDSHAKANHGHTSGFGGSQPDETVIHTGNDKIKTDDADASKSANGKILNK